MSAVTDYLRPSAAGTWSKCYGYAALCASIGAALSMGDDDDEADTEIREDGTACHWLAEVTWNGADIPVGHIAPNGRIITEEMFDAVVMYHSLLESWPGVAPVIEQKVPSSQVIVGCADGTPDAWAYDPINRILYIADLKFGYGFVEVWGNLQLIVYLLAIIKLLNLPPELDIEIRAYIVQPRSGHRDGPVRRWKTTRNELAGYHTILAHAAQMAQAPVPLCTPNPGCKHCPARYGCAALQASALAGVEQAYDSTPHVLTPQGVATELSLLREASRRIEDRITGLEQQAEFELRNGRRIPGYSLKPSFGRTTWSKEFKDSILSLGQLFRVDVAKPPEPVTPAQAKKLGMPTAIVDRYSYRPAGALKLVKDDPNEVAKSIQRSEQ